MKPREHALLGAAGAAALYPALGTGSLVFLAASVLIDFDHYIDYVWHNRFSDFNFRNSFKYHGWLAKKWDRPEFLNIEVFHTVELTVPLLAAAFLLGSAPLLAVCLGFLFHMALDFAYLAARGKPFIRAHSFMEYFLRKRALKRQGLHPEELYFEAARITREGNA